MMYSLESKFLDLNGTHKCSHEVFKYLYIFSHLRKLFLNIKKLGCVQSNFSGKLKQPYFHIVTILWNIVYIILIYDNLCLHTHGFIS